MKRFILFVILLVLFAAYNYQDQISLLYYKIINIPQAEINFKENLIKAKEGDAIAQFNLGVMYASGQGATQDYKEAVKWYRMAADQGDATAQLNLGVMYANGQGVSKDYKEAVKWYRVAADQGNAFAQYNLGLMYSEGQGVTQDHVEALVWYRRAAGQGNASAQFSMGIMYANGYGITRDYVEAYKWILQAELNGKDVTNTKDWLKKLLTESQIAEAQEAAGEEASRKK